MFDVCNSTFSMDGLHLKCESERNRICTLSGSSVLLSASSITSHALCSPFVIILSTLESERSPSTVRLSDVTHLSPSSFVAPYVDISRETAPISSDLPTPNSGPSPDSMDGITIVGINVALESKMLLSGTGPLFSFGLFEHRPPHRPVGCALEMKTDLINSPLLNISSVSTPIREKLGGIVFGSNVHQRLVGCLVSNSSNHQRGTSILDPNVGGSLLCQNTSFSSCVSQPNADQVISYKSHAQGDQFLSTHVTSETVVFILCTFNDMKFTEDGHLLGGAGIFMYQTNAALTVAQCFFHKCVCTGSNNDGSAILFYGSSEIRKPFSLTQSSFTECQSTYDHLGSTSCAFIQAYASQSTISNCHLHLCNATGRGATAYLSNSPAGLSNSTFVKCASLSYYGGAIGLYSVTSVVFSSIQFRKCSAFVAGSADVTYINTAVSLLNETSIQFCDSTSGSPNIYDPDSPSTVLSLIPQLETNTGLFITAFSMKLESSKCVVDMTLSASVVGTMGVLLEGGNVPRLIHVPFGSTGSPSSTGTTEVSVGAEGVLPDLGNGESFSIRSVGLSGKEILGRIDGMEAKLTSITTATLTLSGVFVKQGSSTIMMKDKNGETYLRSLTTNTGTALSGTIPVSLSGPSDWNFGEEYWLYTGTFGAFSTTFTTEVSFVVPWPVAKVSSFTPQMHDDWMILSFTGSELFGQTYTLTLTEQNPSGTPHTKEVSLVPTSSTALSEWNATLFPPSEADLKYDTTYAVTQIVSSISSQSTALPTSLISTPAEPTRVIGLSITGYSEKDKKVEFEVEGLVMTEGETYTLVVNETGTNIQKTINVKFSSPTEGRGSASLFPVSEAELDYNINYTLTRVTDSQSNEILFIAGLSFKTKAEPERLLTISAGSLIADSKKSSITLSFTSSALLGEAEYTLSLVSIPTSDEPAHLKTLTVTTDEDGSIPDYLAVLYPFADGNGKKGQLEFDTTYSLSSLTRQSTPIFFEPSPTTFHTDREFARVIRCLSRVLSEDRQTLIVELEGRAFDAKMGRVCLTRNGKVWKSIGVVSVSSTTPSIVEFGVAEAESDSGVEIGKEYRLMEMGDGSSGCVVDEGIGLVVPRPTVLCRKGGSDNENTCGMPNRQCLSLLVGWLAGLLQRESAEEIVELEVDGEVEMGGVMEVDSEKVVVWGGREGRGRMLVEWKESWESGNAIEVDGGHVWIVEVMILLGSGREGGMEEKSFLICGGGEVSVERVVVGSLDDAKIGIGLIGLSWGSADLVSISLEGVAFGDGVRLVEVGSEVSKASLSVSSLKARRVRTLNAPLIWFRCETEESEVRLEKVVLLETTREERVEELGVEEGGVISLWTLQSETRIVGCVFEGSKTKGLSDGAEIGGVLFVGVGRKGGGRVRFVECLMIDTVPFGRELGGVVVLSSGVCRVWFENCWMEETRVSGLGFGRLDGVPLLSSKRVAVSGVGGVGALIVGEKSLPIVGRSSSRFSGCSLGVVVGTEAAMARQRNEDKKIEL
ncbi:hypothetical protein BLNAU_4392 [Blattamonas nauphoetae]|uniref:Uncharacterized protein n=1 Tax=Blattamonas nauphoetae TaxID=2049346 RepID=A0ABQ9YAD1_9EUKA|nr:hypothetical protein BLNAU_4392 [Blattamonas nauphoetae]